MATVIKELWPEEALFLGTNFSTYNRIVSSTTYPVSSVWFSPTVDQQAFWRFIADSYGSGSLTISIYWYAVNATSGDVIWDAQIDAYTPDTDTVAITAGTFGAISSVTDTHLGTTSGRIMKATITLTDTDGLVAGDYVTLRINRDANNAADTMANEAALVGLQVAYSDT